MEGSGRDNGARKDPKIRRRTTLLGVPAPAVGSAPSPVDPFLPGQNDRPSGSSRVSERTALQGKKDLPTLLLVGSGHPMQDALRAALERHDVQSQETSVDAIKSGIAAATPAVVLVLGDGARGDGKDVIESLRTAGLDPAVPIAVLLDDTSLVSRLGALRAGAAAAIPQSASVDHIAERVSRLARTGDGARGRTEQLGETTLAELLAMLGAGVQDRLLPAGSRGGDPRRHRLVLGESADLLEAFDAFYHSLGTATLKSELIEEDLAHVAEATEEEADAPVGLGNAITGVRVVLADDDSGRADHVADELRRRGATVAVTGLVPPPERMQRLRQLDPMVLLMRAENLASGGRRLLDAMKHDLRLRWVTLVVSDWNETTGPGTEGRAIESLVRQIAATGEADRLLAEAAATGGPVEVRLEDLGPARALRAISGSKSPLRFVVDNPRAQVTVDVSEGLIAGATATEPGDWAPIGQGPAALTALLSLASGALTLNRTQGPRVLNVMSTVARALDLADNEPSPIRSTIPPGAPDADAGNELDGTDESAPRKRLSRAQVRVVAAAIVCAGILGFLGARYSRAPAHPRVDSVPAVAKPAARQTPAQPSTISELAAVPTVSPTAEPISSGAPPDIASGTSLVSRAQAGDPDATAEILRRPPGERSVEEMLALAQGEVVRLKKEIAELGQRAVQSPEVLEDRKVVKQFLDFARKESVAPDTLAALSRVPTPRAADVVYAVWTGTKDKTAATEMAQGLLAGPMRKQSSPALGILLDLRAADTCERTQDLLPRAVEEADRRALRVLGHLVGVRKCGPLKNQDCYPCLKNSKLIPKAVRAARSRPPPL